MILRADEGCVWKNKHTGEIYDVIAIPTGWEDVFEQVEIDLDTSENTTIKNTENNEILERLENVEKQSTKMQSEVSELRNVIKTEIKQLFADYFKLKTE